MNEAIEYYRILTKTFRIRYRHGGKNKLIVTLLSCGYGGTNYDEDCEEVISNQLYRSSAWSVKIL